MSDDSLQQPSPLKEVPTVYSDSTVPVEADHAQLVALVKRLVTKPQEMQALMRKHGLKIDNLDEPMQKLAFTLYTELVELAQEAENLLEVRRGMEG